MSICRRGGQDSPAAAQRACERAFVDAASHGAHLLIVFDGARPTSDAIGNLAETLAVDPLFGLAHPRFADTDGRRVAAPMAAGEASRAGVAREVLATVPDFYVTTEYLSPCFLIRRELVANLAPTLEGWTDAKGMLAEYTVRARRLGFRTIVSNRAVVWLDPSSAGSGELQPDPADVAVVRSAFPEVDRARREFSRAEAFEGERLVSQFFDRPDRWLLDARNLIASVNGTVKAALGVCDGLYKARRGPETSLWVTAAAADFHELDRRYAGWRVLTSTPVDRFAAVLRLSQPWHLTEAVDLHALAPVNVFLMYDTIAWDTVYPAPVGLDATWRYVAGHADGVLFISEFSRQRFQARFDISPSVRTGVVYLSLDPADYDLGGALGAPLEAYWLIVGNAYDHKYVRPTLDLITRSFPGKRMIAVGDRGPKRGPHVTQLESGPTEEARMQALYASAEIVVFPSFYEGFGLPLVNALAYGLYCHRARLGARAGNRHRLSRPRTAGGVRERDRPRRAALAARPRPASPRDSTGAGRRGPLRMGSGGPGHRSLHGRPRPRPVHYSDEGPFGAHLHAWTGTHLKRLSLRSSVFGLQSLRIHRATDYGLRATGLAQTSLPQPLTLALAKLPS